VLTTQHDDDDSCSSLSGSASEDVDEEEEEEEEEDHHHHHHHRRRRHQPQHNMTMLRRESDGHLFAMWSCASLPTSTNPLDVLTRRNRPLQWIILLYTSGHFSAGIFSNGVLQKSKTIHRYTTRRKQGGSQASHDSGGGGPAKSAGAQIRRHNEIMLHKEIHALLRIEWTIEMQDCDSIFISATKRNADVFFGSHTQGTKGEPAVQKSDPRVQRVPFQTRRPTLREVARVCETLGRLHLVVEEDGGEGEGEGEGEENGDEGEEEEETKTKMNDTKKKKKKKKKKKNKNKDALDAADQAVEDGVMNNIKIVDEHPKEREALFQLLRDATTTKQDLQTMLASYSALAVVDVAVAALAAPAAPAALAAPAAPTTTATATAEQILNAQDPVTGETSLHIAMASRSTQHLALLLSSGANPSILDRRHRTPFKIGLEVGAKECRDTLRRYMSLHPNQYDWTTSGVANAGGLTKEDTAAKAARKKESRRRARERKKQRQEEERVEREAEEVKGERGIVDQASGGGRFQPAMNVHLEMKTARLASSVAAELGWSEGDVLASVSSSPENSWELLTCLQRMLAVGEAPEDVVRRLVEGSVAMTPRAPSSSSSVSTTSSKMKPPARWLEEKAVKSLQPKKETNDERRAKMAAAAEARMKR